MTGSSLDRDVDAALVASRALLGIVARSLADALDSVTLPQFRLLVILSGEGPLRMGVLSERLAANPSTFSRSVDRMVEGGWVRRVPSPDSGRETLLELTDAGAAIVEQVSSRRREDLRAVLKSMPADERSAVRAALRSFAAAAGEPSAAELLTIGL